MIKFYREFVSQLVVIMMYLKYVLGCNTSFSDMKAAVDRIDVELIPVELRDPLADSVTFLEDHVRSHPDSPLPNLEGLFKDLTIKENGDDLSIIDLMITALKEPFQGNFLSGRIIRALKRAIMTTSELDALRTALEKREYHCRDCNRLLVHGEAVFAYLTPDQTGLYCIRCMVPTYFPCSSCDDGHVQLSSSMRSAFISNKSACPQCLQRRNAEPGGVNARIRGAARGLVLENVPVAAPVVWGVGLGNDAVAARFLPIDGDQNDPQ